MSNPKILVVDDNTRILYAFSALLENEGYLCTGVRKGREALDKLRQEKPHAVFLDVSLPDYHGFELLKKIRQLAPLLPVVIITSLYTERLKSRAAELGVAEILEKPLTISRLREVILHLGLNVDPGRLPSQPHIIL